MNKKNECERVYHFPRLHSGACFYDILSRFHEESGHFTSAATSKELFGSSPDLRPAVVLPYRAELISTWLGPSADITPEIIRDKYTAWQYLQLDREFSDNELIPIIRADAKPGRRKQAKMRSVLQNHVVKLRYCPQCIASDFLKEGEPFWHQVHQIFGVKYCPIHGISLMDSDVSLEKKLVHYVPASTVLLSSSLKKMIDTDITLSQEEGPLKGTYLKLAKTIDWLLMHGLEFIKSNYREKYRRTLGIKSELSVNEGGKMKEFLLSTLGRLFLEDLFLDDTVDVFLSSIEQMRIADLPPLYHALMLTAMGDLEQH